MNRSDLGKLPVFAVVCLLPLVVFGAFGTFLSTHDPNEINLSNVLQPPAWIDGGEWAYFLGTDQLGRDLYSRLVAGARTSLLIALLSVGMSGFIGTTIGLTCGLAGGSIDHFMMRISDGFIAIPQVFFLLMMVAVMRQAGLHGIWVIVISIAITSWVPFAQMIRGETISLKNNDYVVLAKITGCSKIRILRKHILPNVTSTGIILATGMFGAAIMAEAGATFLGVGIQPPDTAWGMMISESSVYVRSAWWIPSIAGGAITITIIGFNLLGDWLRDVLDYKAKNSYE